MVAIGGPGLDGSSNPSQRANRSGADATDSRIRPRAQRSTEVEAAGITFLKKPCCGVAMLALKKPPFSYPSIDAACKALTGATNVLPRIGLPARRFLAEGGHLQNYCAMCQ